MAKIDIVVVSLSAIWMSPYRATMVQIVVPLLSLSVPFAAHLVLFCSNRVEREAENIRL
jgi:uncharacterized membrane protein